MMPLRLIFLVAAMIMALVSPTLAGSNYNVTCVNADHVGTQRVLLFTVKAASGHVSQAIFPPHPLKCGQKKRIPVRYHACASASGDCRGQK